MWNVVAIAAVAISVPPTAAKAFHLFPMAIDVVPLVHRSMRYLVGSTYYLTRTENPLKLVSVFNSNFSYADEAAVLAH